MSVTIAYDITGANIGQAPAGAQLAGYATGSGGIAWTAADWAAHPGAVRIDQDPAASDVTADVLDSEAGAVPVGSAELAAWAKRALADFESAARPGQRRPAVYQSAANVTANVNALIAGGVTSGVGLFVANWNLTDAQATADVNAASGPFPIIGIQWKNAGAYDTDVFSTAWLADVSRAAPAAPASSGVQARWRWCHKCQGLFNGPGASESHCPAPGGGPHDMTGSYDYHLTYTNP